MTLTRLVWVVAAVASFAPTRAAVAACDDPTAVAAARAAVAAQCPCGVPRHGTYVSCAARVANELGAEGALPAACRRDVKRCAARSVCGKPGRVTCCRPSRRGPKCKITTAERCLTRGGCVGSYESCCDACGTDGCNPTTTTTLPPSVCGNGIVEPPEWCDGQVGCTSVCTVPRFACCELPTSGGACSADVPPFTLFVNQYAVCGAYGGTFIHGREAATGDACAEPAADFSYPQVEGGCVAPEPLPAPIDLCCQGTFSCSATSSAAPGDLASFVWYCAYENYPYFPIVGGTCGDDGLCVPPS